ncbi:hypothetical protein SARC_16772, partial [Sphaeroforma arctica JP610]
AKASPEDIKIEVAVLVDLKKDYEKETGEEYLAPGQEKKEKKKDAKQEV